MSENEKTFETDINEQQQEPQETQEKPESIFNGESQENPNAKWYVVHTYSGHENKVKVNIEKMVENRGMQDLILKIVVPTQTVVETKDGKTKTRERKLFPGYVIVKMERTDETWYLVRNTQGVTGFVGHGSEPIPLSDDEVNRMGIEKVYVSLDVAKGETIKIINGPFAGQEAVVKEINNEKRTLKVVISVFNRDTDVDIDFTQVGKIK